MIRAVRRLLRGEASLGGAFWGWGVAGFMAVTGIFTLAGMMLLLLSGDAWLLLLALGFAIVWIIASSIGIWRSAARRLAEGASPLWPRLAQAVVVVNIVTTLASLPLLGAMISMFGQIGAELRSGAGADLEAALPVLMEVLNDAR